MGESLADGAEEQPRRCAVAAGADYEKHRVARLLDQHCGRMTLDRERLGLDAKAC
jgi:hypothetical protein